MVKMTKVRGFIAASVAIALVVILAGVVTAMMGLRVPVLIDITNALGLT